MDDAVHSTSEVPMRRILLATLLLALVWTDRPVLAQGPAAALALEQAGIAPTSAPATAPANTSEQGASPTTQPAQAASRSLTQIDLIRVLKGEKALTPEQLFQLGYWIEFAKDLIYGVLQFIPRLFVAIFLFLIFWVIYRTVRRVLVGGMKRAGVDPSIRDMLASLLKWSILGFGLVIAGNQVGIQIAALLTGVSIIGLAIGFAAQETLSNFIAGIVIFWDHPFGVGDWIMVDGVFGQVQRVTFRSTRLLNHDGEVVIFPNTYMLANRVGNHTVNPVNRVSVSIGIAYKESIAAARKALLDVVSRDGRICADPAPTVVVVECGDSSVNLELRFWIRDESIEVSIHHEYMEKAKNTLDEAGIQIPFPHMQLLLEQTPAVESLSGRPGSAAA
jgi:small conductance mechanosensitive channel